VLVAGFYYKTFMWPPKGWLTYERWIRRAAGLGRATDAPDPDAYDRMNGHADVVVVGAGPAGLAAALAAGKAGARVVLLESGPVPGGRLLDEPEVIGGESGRAWRDGVLAALGGLTEVTVLTRSTAFGLYDGNLVGVVERMADHLPEPPPYGVRQRYWKLRAGTVVIAAGAFERPLVFAGNDRPGVMLASAARTYVNRYAVRPGRRAVVFANNDDGYRTGLELKAGGLEVSAVLDAREAVDSAWLGRARAAGLDCRLGTAVVRALGGLHLAGVDVMSLSGDGRALTGRRERIACDLLALSGGWDPALHLHAQAGGRPRYDPALAAFVPGDRARGDPIVAGAANGAFRLGDCLAQGLVAGAEAAARHGHGDGRPPSPPRVETLLTTPIRPLWRALSAGRGGKAFVDLQNDVTVEDVALAHREGYHSIEHLKRYTTLGMGTEQGKTANVNGLALMAEARRVPIGEVGTTTYRPPYVPVALGALAGPDVGLHEAPIRRSAMHAWHAENGAVFVDAGLWKRPNYYLRPGETRTRAEVEAAVAREVVAVRNGAGVVDVSTLGKIDLQGRDSTEFLNRLYVNGFARLELGRARYGLMLREDGLAFDDGTVSRLGERHYLITTTTANAGLVMTHIEYYLQAVWPELRAKAVSVTEQWAGIALAGPKAREVLAKVAPGLDVANAGLPFMGIASGRVAGVAGRVFRISFSGELAYEINVPADYGHDVWCALLEAGEPQGIVAYGTEAMSVMRIEKGHVAGGELNGQTTADDLGLGRLVSRVKPFIGGRMLDREAFVDAARPKLVGLVPVDGATRIEAGAQLVGDPDEPPPMRKLGHVSSTAYVSPTVGHPVSLGFCAHGRERIGETLWALSPLHGQRVEVRLTEPVFYDPEGGRQRG
jgi:sarcosine oxidase subunit alpha